MLNNSKHKGWRKLTALLWLAMLMYLPACGWIAEFDQRYQTQISTEPVDTVRIVWVNSYTEGTLWSTRMQTGMLETLARQGYTRPDGTLEWRAFHLQAVGTTSLAELRLRVQKIIPEIMAFDPDVIIVSDDEAALTFVPLYPNRDVPIVYCGVTTSITMTGLDRPNVFGIPEPIYAAETLAIARTMAPQHRKNLILADASVTGRASANAAVAQLLGSDTDEEPPIVEIVKDWEAWKQVVSSYTYDVDLVLIASHHALPDKNGDLVSPERMLQWTLYNSWAPVFAFTNTAVVNGAVAGLVTDAYDQGRNAALLAFNLAKNGDMSMAESQSIIETTNRLVLNLAAAKRWSLKVPVMFPIAAEVYDKLPRQGGAQ